MRRAFLIGCLILVAFAAAATQTPVTGRWRAVLLTPDGGTQNISLELDAKGETVTGTIEGLAIGEGRLDGNTLTLRLSAPNKQEVSLTGQVDGDEIVFKSSGLPPGPIQFVALVEAAAVIRGSARETDVAARFGGDEFALILPETGSDGASAVAERVRDRLASHPFLAGDGLSIRLTASVGVATLPDVASTAEELVRAADMAMYRVKEAGKNGIHVARV